MESGRTRNDLSAALVRFCVAVEEHRRTPEGRVRTPAQFLAHFFSTEGPAPKDEIFRHMPKEVRGPILSTWGIRGAKAALRDDDEKVASVVFDALAAGDLDDGAFERAITADKLLAWVPLASFWSFWRAGTISKPALLRAFSSAYELRLLDARMFFETLKARNGEITGTDVLGQAFTKEDLIEWMRRVHASGDGSPKGILEAVGWEKIVQKAPIEPLLGALDALAARLGLAEGGDAPAREKTNGTEAKPKSIAPAPVKVEPPPAPSREAADAGPALEIEIETGDSSAPAESGDAFALPAVDLAKTGTYVPSGKEAAPVTEDDEDEPNEETKLYRTPPSLRR